MGKHNCKRRYKRKHKHNWHYDRYKDRQRELEKRAPRFLYHKTPLSPQQRRIRDKLNLERHWYSGMMQISNGHTKLNSDLRATTRSYNADGEICDNIDLKQNYEKWDYKY